MARKSKLTSELIILICDNIRLGAFDHVAAASAGISRSTFYSWLQQAEQPDADPLFLEFLDKVSQAKATARQVAEARVFQENPFAWLRFGPGKDRPQEPGWTAEVAVNVNANGPIVLNWNDDAHNPAQPARITTQDQE